MIMTKLLTNTYNSIKKTPYLSALLVISSIFGAYQATQTTTGAWDSPLALFLLVIASSVYGINHLPQDNVNDHYSAWIFLTLALFLMIGSIFYDTDVGKNSAIMFACFGGVCYLSDWRSLKFFLLPLLLCYLGLPFLENITLFISYPLRLISTELTVGLLQLFNVGVSSELTTIYIDKTQMAITDACSGVSQLGVLLFFAWILMHKFTKMKWVHKFVWCLFILPIVIIANTIRLLLTIALFFALSERAFENDIHISLGYFFIFLSIGFLWGCGKILLIERDDNA